MSERDEQLRAEAAASMGVITGDDDEGMSNGDAGRVWLIVALVVAAVLTVAC